MRGRVMANKVYMLNLDCLALIALTPKQRAAYFRRKKKVDDLMKKIEEAKAAGGTIKFTNLSD